MKVAVLTIALLMSMQVDVSFASEDRYTTVFAEHHDGVRQEASAAESGVTAALLTAGVIFVDEGQARRIRSVSDAGALLAGKIPDVITVRDADVILAAVVKSGRVKTNVFGTSVARYEARLDAKLIAVDNGRILRALTTRGGGMGMNAEQAALQAAEKAGQALAADLIDWLAQRKPAGRRVEIEVDGLPDVAAAGRVAKRIGELRGVESVRTLQVGRGVTKLAVTTSADSQQLAMAMETTEGIGLDVFGFTERAIKAAYSPTRALRLALIVPNFEGKVRKPWQRSTLAVAVETTLANQPFVTAADSARRLNLPKDPKKWTTVLSGAGIEAQRAIVVIGRVTPAKRGVTLGLVARAGSDGSTLASKTAHCADRDVVACAAELAEQLGSALLPSIQNKRHLFRGGLLASGSAARTKPLRFGKIDLGHVLPAQVAGAGQLAIGQVRLTNGGDRSATSVIITAEVVGLTSAAVDSEPITLDIGASADVDLRVAFDRAKLKALTENSSSVLSLRLAYSYGEFRIEDRRTQPFLLYDKNALQWTEPNSVAAFVTHRNESVLEVARGAVAGQTTVIDKAVALFEVVRQIEYVRDPVNPFRAADVDFVQFPAETLSRAAGDCDDLAVLYAAIAEAVSLRAALVTVPGHVFVAIASGVPTRNHSQLMLDPNGMHDSAGEAWIVIETTKTDGTFRDAWRAAANTLTSAKRAGRALEFIEVRRAWSQYAPADLSLAAPSRVRVAESQIQKALATQRGERRAALEAALAQLTETTPAVLNRKAHLLALSGEFQAARTAIEVAKAKRASFVEPNNAGNVAMMEGKPTEAVTSYRDAASRAPKNVAVHLNLAVAYWGVGDSKQFTSTIVTCLELGGEAEVNLLSRTPGLMGGGVTAARGDAMPSMHDALREAYAAARKPVPSDVRAATTRASEDTERPELNSMLSWLE